MCDILLVFTINQFWGVCKESLLLGLRSVQQARFQTMSESIITKNILLAFVVGGLGTHLCTLFFELLVCTVFSGDHLLWSPSSHYQCMCVLFWQAQGLFLAWLAFSNFFYTSERWVSTLTGSLDEMGSRIDDLEKSISDLTKEMGVEMPPSKPGGDEKPEWDDNISIL